MEKLYRIEELATSGWSQVDDNDHHLTKEQATNRLDQLISEGYNPNRLRVVPQE